MSRYILRIFLPFTRTLTGYFVFIFSVMFSLATYMFNVSAQKSLPSTASETSEYIQRSFVWSWLLDALILVSVLATATLLYKLFKYQVAKWHVKYGHKAKAMITGQTLSYVEGDSGVPHAYWLNGNVTIYGVHDSDKNITFKAYLSTNTEELKNDVLTYPARLYVRLPKQNEEFEIIYIPGSEKYFRILNTGDSEFAHNIQHERVRQEQEKQLKDFQGKIAETKIRMKLESTDEQAKSN